MRKKTGTAGKDPTLMDSLAGPLAALLGPKAGELFASRASRKSVKKTGDPQQDKVLDMLQAIDMQLAAEHYEGLKSSCLLLIAHLKEICLQKERETGKGHFFLSRVYYRLFERLGDFFFASGLPDEARDFYEELLPYYPTHVPLLKKIARSCYVKGANFLGEAEKYYRQALDHAPGDLEIYENLGRIMENLPDHRRDAFFIYREALQHCRSDMDSIRFYLRLLDLDSDDPELPLRLGRIYQRQGMFLEARRYLEQAFELSGEPWVVLDLALVYYQLNDTAKAEQTLQLLEEAQDPGPYCDYQMYLWGLLNEKREKGQEAEEYWQAVGEKSSYYWKAQLGLARIHMNRGEYEEAAVRVAGVPDDAVPHLEKELLELGLMQEEHLEERQHPGLLKLGRCLRGLVEEYPLKKDIVSRSQGPVFWRKYEAMEVIGGGTLGQVLLSRHRQSGRIAAIKQIGGGVLSDPRVIRRIQGQLRTMRSIEHPNFLEIYEDSYWAGHYQYAMEHLEAETLAHYIQRLAPLPLTRLASISLDLCEALCYLYEKEILLHGGLKPSSVFLLPSGRAVLGDFDLLWTLEGSRVFSPPMLKEFDRFPYPLLYAAPERFPARGLFGSKGKIFLKSEESKGMGLEGVDHRSDLYSLGLIMFEMATGFLPFQPYTVEAALAFHKAKNLPPIRDVNPTFPPELEEILSRLLDRNPSQRYAEPSELKDAIKKTRI